MDRLPSDARRLLEQAKAAETPGAADRERVWAALEAQLALPGSEAAHAGGEGAPGTPEAPDTTRATGGGGAGGAGGMGATVTLALVGLGLALLAGVALVTQPGEPAPAAVNVPTSADETARVHVSGPGTAASEAGAAADRAPEQGGAVVASAPMTEHDEPNGAASDEAGAPPADGAGATPRERAPSAAESAPAGDDIAADVALLHQAQSAWRAGRAGEALSLAERHRATFPRSALGRERDAIRVLALCALGREESARRIATRLLATSGASPWRQAVAESCGGR